MFAGILAGLLAGGAILFLLFKFDVKKVLYFEIIIDVISTSLLTTLMHGTFFGMCAALTGGFVISLYLYVARRMYGYKRLSRPKWYSWPRWEIVEPKWRIQ